MTDSDTPDWAPHINPGHHAPEPPSHAPVEIPRTLYELLDRCAALWGESPHPRADNSWPRLRAGLRHHRRVLAAVSSDDVLPALAAILSEIDEYGRLNRTHRHLFG
jgi:hypothetical protein